MKIRMFHVATVNEEVLVSALLTRRLGLTHEAGDATHRCVDVQRQKVLIDFLAEDVHDALSQTAGTEIIHLVVVIIKRESYLGIYKGYTLESAYNVVKFSGIRFQELPSCRNIEEEISILKLLPTGHEHGSCDTKREPAMVSSVPTSSSAMRVLNSTCDTAAMEASASPRNPIVCRLKRSSACRIFDVA